jgi:hypothetical protein
MAAEYRLVSYADGGAAKAGVLIGDRVVPAATLLAGADGIDNSSVLGLLRSWDRAHPRLAAAAQNVQPDDGIALAQIKLLAPILYPGALYCAGANYWDHLEEMAEIAKRTTGKAPSINGVLVLGGQGEPEDVGVIFGLLVEVGHLVAVMGDLADADHVFLLGFDFFPVFFLALPGFVFGFARGMPPMTSTIMALSCSPSPMSMQR